MRLPYSPLDLAFILCVNLLPIILAVAFGRGRGLMAFLAVWFVSMAGGVVVWLLTVLLTGLFSKRR